MQRTWLRVFIREIQIWIVHDRAPFLLQLRTIYRDYPLHARALLTPCTLDSLKTSSVSSTVAHRRHGSPNCNNSTPWIQLVTDLSIIFVLDKSANDFTDCNCNISIIVMYIRYFFGCLSSAIESNFVFPVTGNKKTSQTELASPNSGERKSREENRRTTRTLITKYS